MISQLDEVQSLLDFKANPARIPQSDETFRSADLADCGRQSRTHHSGCAKFPEIAGSERPGGVHVKEWTVSLQDVEAGRTRPLAEFDLEMRQKYGIQH